MKNIIYLLSLISLHIIAETNFTKVTFQRLIEKDYDGNVITLYDKDNIAQSVKVIAYYNILYPTRALQTKEMFIPTCPIKHFLKKEGWKHIYYHYSNSFDMIAATSNNVFIYATIPTVGPYGRKYDQKAYSSIMSTKKDTEVKAHLITTHNNCLGKIQYVTDRRLKSYVFSSSTCPSIKVFQTTLQNPPNDPAAPLFEINPIECNGDQSYLLGANRDYIMYAYVKNIPGFFSWLFNTQNTLDCAIAVKKINDFETEGLDFTKNRENETISDKIFNLSIDLKNLPHVFLDEHRYGVLYNPADNNLAIIDFDKKNIFTYRMPIDKSFTSVAIIFSKKNFNATPTMITAYLLSPDSELKKDFEITKVRFNIEKANFEKEETFNIEKNMSIRSKIIGISQFTSDNEEQLLCISHEGKAYKIDVSSKKELTFLPILSPLEKT